MCSKNILITIIERATAEASVVMRRDGEASISGYYTCLLSYKATVGSDCRRACALPERLSLPVAQVASGWSTTLAWRYENLYSPEVVETAENKNLTNFN